jgi:hypothetical protein
MVRHRILEAQATEPVPSGGCAKRSTSIWRIAGGARDEFLLAAIAQNLRRMAKRLMFAAPEAVPIAA